MAVRAGVLRGAVGLKNNMKPVNGKAGRIRMECITSVC